MKDLGATGAKGLDDIQTTPSLLKWFSPLGAACEITSVAGVPEFDSHAQRGAARRYLEDFWFYARNNHPALFSRPWPCAPCRRRARGGTRPAGLRDLGGGCRRQEREKPWTSLNNYARNAQITVAYVTPCLS